MVGATDIIKVFQLYSGDTWFLLLSVAAVGYLLVKSSRANRRNIVLAVIAAGLIIFNEISFRIVGRVNGTETYYRFLWMIPVVPLTGYAAADILIRQKGILKRAAAVLAVLAVIVLAGTPYLHRGSFKLPQEVSYLNRNAEEVGNIILGDAQMECPKVACEYNLVTSLRIYEPMIRHAIERDTYRFGGELKTSKGRRKRQLRLLRLVQGEKMNPKVTAKTLKRTGTDYVVIANEYNRDEHMQNAGCSVVERTALYTVYRVE